ncbi:MAG: hypothetical protein Crog4KO_14320 [Crocinitomicaceae bacterium]
MVAFSDMDNGEPTSVILFDDQACIKALSIDNLISIYPNPARTHVNIDSGGLSIGSVCIRDLSGKLVVNKRGNVNDFIDTSSLESGVYIMPIETESGSIAKQLIRE